MIPVSAQRRTVSSVTWSNRAAWEVEISSSGMWRILGYTEVYRNQECPLLFHSRLWILWTIRYDVGYDS